MKDVYENPLIVLEAGEDGGAAIETAKLVSGQHARMTLATVVEPLPDLAQLVMPAPLVEWYRAYVAQQEEHLQECIQRAQPEPGPGCSWQHVVLRGTAHAAVLRQVHDGGHDLVVKVARAVEAGTAAPPDRKLLRKAPCAVLFARTVRNLRNIAVAVAPLTPGDPPEETASTMAFNTQLILQAQRLCAHAGARLHVIQAWNIPLESWMRGQARDGEMEGYFAQVASAIEAEFKALLERCNFSVPVETHFHRGTPEEVIPIVLEDEDIDLLVMGTVARTGLAGHVLGNTAETLLNSHRASMLVCKPGQA